MPWGDVLGDRIIATAILDRLVHYAVTRSTRGNSCRLEEKHTAARMRSEDEDTQTAGDIQVAVLGAFALPLTPQCRPAAGCTRGRWQSSIPGVDGAVVRPPYKPWRPSPRVCTRHFLDYGGRWGLTMSSDRDTEPSSSRSIHAPHQATGPRREAWMVARP